MRRYCREVSGPKLANMLESGITPILPPDKLKDIGFSVAAYPLTLVSSSAKAMQKSLTLLQESKAQRQELDNQLLSFEELKGVVGFSEYYHEMDKYGLS